MSCTAPREVMEQRLITGQGVPYPLRDRPPSSQDRLDGVDRGGT